jgi:phosphoglycolate phosphatase
MIGPPLTEIFEHFLGSLDEDRMLGLVARYRERYADIGYRENIIYEHIAELIHKLAASGFVLGVCTSKRADYAERIIEMFGLGPCFSFIDGGDIHIKKYMQLEQLVAAGLDAASTVMVGDRGVDIEAARLNAIQSVGVSWGFAHRNELQEAGADHIANNPLELGKLFL